MSQESNHWLGFETKKPIGWLSLVRLSAWCATGLFVFWVFGLGPVVSSVQAAGPSYPGRAITTNTTWSLNGTPYVVQYVTLVNAGVTLTIEPGVVVKVTRDGMLTVNGTIEAAGTAEAPVIFTSYKDDIAGGDSNNDGSLTKPAAGDWSWLKFASGSSGSLSYVEFRYGGYYWQQGRQDGQLIVEGSSPTISHLSITRGFRGGFGFGVRIINGSPTISNSFIANDYPATTGDSYGFIIYGGAPKILNSEVTSNFQAGIAFAQGYTLGSEVLVSGNRIYNNGQPNSPVRYGLVNFTTSSVDARNNWWGSDSGPKTLSNSGGVGQEIYGPVLYDPWIGKVTNQPPVLSWLGVGGYQSDGVDPSVSFTGSAPAFKVVYTDPDNDAPALLKVFIDAASYDMVADSGQDGDFKNGEVYYFTPPLDALIKGLRQYHFETSDGTVSTRLPAQGELVFEVRNIPVILIPGILGTEMKRGDELLWMDLSQMLFSTNDDFLDPLQMNSDGLPSDSLVSASDVVRFKDIPGPFNYDYFDGLVKEFISKGYIEDDDIFVFPYDWRLDIRVIAQSLNNKIIQVLSQSGSLKVDLVAHSMGGLVAKQYIIDNPESKIDKLIFIGTPHLGAPKALKALLFGDTFGVPLILNQLEMKKLAQNMLSVYQLLPSKEYFNRIGSYYYDLSSTNQNEHKVLTFLETKALLVNRDYNILGIESADSLHTEAYDNLNLSTYGVDSYNISGCKSPTITGIVQLNKPNFVGSLLGETEYMLYMGAGDETVPLGSSTGVNVSYANSYYYKSAEHSKMPSQESIRNLVTQIVTGKINNSDLPTDVIQDSTQCKLKGKLVSVHSPVELHVYDAQGNHVGPAENNSIEEGIGGVTYEEVDGNKFVFLSGDTSQSYTVKLQATGNGSFNMRVKDIVDDAVGNTIYYNQVPITSSSKAELAINSVVTGDLLLDSAGNGNLEVIQPSAILDATQSQDLVKPTTTISLSGTSGTNGWFKSQVAISLTAIDDNAGVLRTEYSLDSGQTWVTYNDPFNVTSEGKITILYRSIDRAGNIEEFKSQEVKIDAIPPEANIVFDQQIKDIVITGIDALSSVSVTEVDNITTLVDEAGNTTELRFSEKNRRRSLSASLLSIKYNGVELSTAKRNKFNYVWVYNKQGVLRELIQSITFNNDFVISAVYNSKRNVTMIMGKDVEKKKTREIYKGLKLINIVTDKGKISYNIN